jgi:hypothetical protein
MSKSHPVTPDLTTLASLFYGSLDLLGEFEEQSA